MSAPTSDETYFDQSTYQVRLDWGVAGLGRLAPADIVVVVDVLRFSSRVTRLLEANAGARVPLDGSAHALSVNGAAVAHAATSVTAPDGGAPVILLGCLRNARAVANACLEIQNQRGRRTSVTIIPAGEIARVSGSITLRFAVEDQLGAGAIVAALSELGTDHTSPDAAAACESALGLRSAMKHLVTASGSGVELVGRGEKDDVVAAASLDVTDIVPVLRDRAFVAF